MKRTRSISIVLALVAGIGGWLLAWGDNINPVGQAAPPQTAKYEVNTGAVEVASDEAFKVVSDDSDAPDDVAQLTELSVDDGSFEAGLGTNQSATLYCVNRLRPPSYPATINQVRIFFRTNDNLSVGAPITVLVGANLDGDENIDGTSLSQQIPTAIQTLGSFNSYSVNPLTINSGDFVVGFRMTISPTQFPGALDTNSGTNRRSYTSTDGFDFTVVNDINNGVPDGDFGIRALVNLGLPILNVSPSTLTFTTNLGNTNPQSQNFTVSNSGSGTLSYTITSSNTGLVTTSPTAGTLGSGGLQTITAFVVPPNQSGTFTATLTVNAAGAQNNPQTVTVIMNVLGQPPTLSVSPTTLVFAVTVGQGNPSPQTFTVQNTGGAGSFFNFSISSNNGAVLVSPTSGGLGAGQSQQIQVSVINPNSPGTINAQITVTAPGAQNSPQFVNVSINTQQGGPLGETEPNDSPQSAPTLPQVFQGSSITINGDGRPGDTGTQIDQIMAECMRDRLIQDWFRLVVNQRDAYQATLTFNRDAADFDLFIFIQTNDFAHFPEGVQLIASSAQGPGQDEAFRSRVLEPGTYFIAVSRVRRSNLSDLNRVSYALTISRGSSPETHAIEDVACIGYVDPESSGKQGYLVVNRVRPTRYPARLEAISVLFASLPGQISPAGRPVRLIAFADPSGNGNPPFNPGLLVNQVVTVTQNNQFNQLNLGSAGPVINSGDFYVGYVVDVLNGIQLNLGRVIYPNIRSFVSSNGGQTYQQLNVVGPNAQLFNAAIRPTVNTRPFGKMDEEANRLIREEMERIDPMILSIEP